jgi:hypothetical protein
LYVDESYPSGSFTTSDCRIYFRKKAEALELKSDEILITSDTIVALEKKYFSSLK